MNATKFGKLFMNGNSQAVRLPQEFRFEGTKVRVRRFGNGVLLEQDRPDLDAWFAKLHRNGGNFEIVRDQPPTPETEVIFD